MRLSYFLPIALFVLPKPGAAQPGRIQVDIAPIVESDGVHAGTSPRAAVQVRLQRGFHVNSNEPLEEYLIPTSLRFAPLPGVNVNGLVYPEAIHLVTGGSETPLAVFEEEFAIGVVMELDPALATGEHVLFGQLDYQACDDKVCYRPDKRPVQVTLNVVGADQTLRPTNAAVFDAIDFTKTTPAGVLAEAPELNLADAVPPGGGDVLTALDDFTIVGTTGGFLGTKAFIAFIDDAEAGRVRQGWFEGKGAFAIVAIVLLGGLALNLTPCVLPMIPINLGIIGAGAQGGSRVQGFLLGGAYGLAMAFVYGALGLVVILTAGTFGTINASPWFNLAIAVLFLVLALAMFDIITIDFSGLQSKVQLSRKGGKYLVAFGMGAVAALLAGACVAPVVIQVVVFSSDLYAKGQMLALALPFLLGTGMAIPWPVAGAGVSLLPRPGVWMVRVKQGFGVLILGFAVYYGYLAYGIVSQRFVDATEVADSAREKIKEGWVPSLDAGLAQAKAENKMVLVDVWATWCKNCLTMDKTTFKDPEVLARLDDYVKIKYQAEDPEAWPAREVIKRFDGIGLPVYAILKPR
ncbi:MAG: hypothetical protein BMS9Abin37_2348 [Acidobacteriota bacterium]|nr:MAG: hypothetical protein BMS9Abin37_2348 [Acidobacteriota bacterium]